ASRMDLRLEFFVALRSALHESNEAVGQPPQRILYEAFRLGRAGESQTAPVRNSGARRKRIGNPSDASHIAGQEDIERALFPCRGLSVHGSVLACGVPARIVFISDIGGVEKHAMTGVLLRNILGAGFDGMPEAVRVMHNIESTQVVHGVSRVMGGKNPLSRF